MKKRFTVTKILCALLLAALCLPLAACAGKAYTPSGRADANVYNRNENLPSVEMEQQEGEQTGGRKLVENPFVSTAQQPVSTFSADVDTASYALFRKLVGEQNRSLEALRSGYYSDAFRTEEFINYFKYQANLPEGDDLFGVTSAVSVCPWNEENALLRLTLRASDAIPSAGNNLVFLIDVSGSMANDDKLPLLQKCFGYLTDQLTSRDRVSIVTYASGERVVLENCPGNEGATIRQALNGLKASGSTNGEAGMKKAYEIAAQYKIEGGNNRIIMASDGDLNVGISSAEELKKFVEEKRDGGIFLSVLGFGTGNYRDRNMEAIADHGNGVYYYIDGESEARRVLGTDLLSTLYTVAKDTKLQITFNPDRVSSYRLIGYENRLLATEDFDDDTKDAGDVGAGHQVTVCYELKLTETALTADDEWMKLAVRYKRPDENQSLLNEYSIGASAYSADPDDDFRFLAAVIETVMLLNNSNYLPASVTKSTILSNLDLLNLTDPYRMEFHTLVGKI